MSNSLAKVSIVIPHWNNVEVLSECLKSIRSSNYSDFEVIVVDNASTDNSVQYVKSNFPEVKLFENTVNDGYAGGCNIGANLAKGEYLVFLNNDTIQEPNWISSLLSTLVSKPQIAAVQPKILNYYDRKIFDYAGSISIERTWRESGKEVNRQVKMSDISNIKKALNDGWVITFPQGTTKPFKPIRKGTAHIIKHYKPVVVPIVIDGFRRAYDKKGIRIKKKNILQSMEIKPPLDIDYDNESIEKIVEKIQYSIEQHPSFLKVMPQE